MSQNWRNRAYNAPVYPQPTISEATPCPTDPSSDSSPAAPSAGHLSATASTSTTASTTSSPAASTAGTSVTTADLPPLPAGHEQRGGDPALVGKELLSFIADHIDRNPRSLQKAVGPSELGTPCKRKLAYKMLGLPEINSGDPAWFPTIGTAVHAWLEDCLGAYNASTVIDRFYLEERVTVGQVGGVDISGSCDVYDRVTATIIDWKVVGDTKLDDYRRHGPGDQYRRQAHLYGRGYRLAGLPVDNVAVMFLPRNKMLSKAHFWTEPYDEALAVDTLATADALHQLVTAGGVHALPLIPTTDDYCRYCPYRVPGSTDLAAGCPGDSAIAEAATQVPATLADALN